MNLTRRFLLFIFFSSTVVALTPVAYPADSSLFCSKILHDTQQALTTHGSFSSEWKNMLLRNEAAEFHAPKKYLDLYLQRSTEAIFTVFLPWFEEKTNESYFELMSKMKRTLTFGNENLNHYPELSQLDYSGLVAFLKLKKMQRRPITIYSGFFEKHLGKIEWAADLSIRAQGQKFIFALFPEKINELKNNEPTTRFIKAGTLKIPFISDSSDYPKNEIRIYGIAHFYPTGSGVLDRYLQVSETLFTQIRRDFYSLSKDALIEKLATYYYVSINAHYFNKINNSILFNQLNTILMLKGLNGIPHGNLDYYALLVQFDDFKNIFKKAVWARNPFD